MSSSGLPPEPWGAARPPSGRGRGAGGGRFPNTHPHGGPLGFLVPRTAASCSLGPRAPWQGGHGRDPSRRTRREWRPAVRALQVAPKAPHAREPAPRCSASGHSCRVLATSVCPSCSRGRELARRGPGHARPPPGPWGPRPRPSLSPGWGRGGTPFPRRGGGGARRRVADVVVGGGGEEGRQAGSSGAAAAGLSRTRRSSRVRSCHRPPAPLAVRSHRRSA